MGRRKHFLSHEPIPGSATASLRVRVSVCLACTWHSFAIRHRLHRTGSPCARALRARRRFQHADCIARRLAFCANAGCSRQV